MNSCCSLSKVVSLIFLLQFCISECSAQKKTVVQNRIGFSVYDYSEGDNSQKIPILYFHGTSSSKREGDLFVDQIRDKKRLLISFDRPGYGDSCAYPFHCLDDYDRWVESHLFPAIHEVLGFKPVRYDFVSVSGGAVYALRTIQAKPDRVRKISLLSAGLFARPVGGEGRYEWARRLAAKRPRVAELIVKVGKRRPEIARSMAVKKFSAPDKRFADCNRALARKLYLDATRQGASGIVQDAKLQLCDTSYAKPLPKGVQGEIWKGSCDQTISLASSKLLSEKTAIELNVIQNEGHLSCLPIAFQKSVLPVANGNLNAAE